MVIFVSMRFLCELACHHLRNCAIKDTKECFACGNFAKSIQLQRGWLQQEGSRGKVQVVKSKQQLLELEKKESGTKRAKSRSEVVRHTQPKQ